MLYAREHLLGSMLPFLYGGDMIAEGRVFPWQVECNALLGAPSPASGAGCNRGTTVGPAAYLVVPLPAPRGTG